MDFNKYRNLSLESIKSVYISEDLGTMCRYADPMFTPMNIDKIYGCVVLIETLPEEEVSVKGAKGVRKTWLEGYSKVKEFIYLITGYCPAREITDGHYTGIRN